MPLFDVLSEDGTVQEVFVHRAEQIKDLGVKVLPPVIHVGGKPTEESFEHALLDGYKRAEAKGGRFAHTKKQVDDALNTK